MVQNFIKQDLMGSRLFHEYTSARSYLLRWLMPLAILFGACAREEPATEKLLLLGTGANGQALVDGAVNIPLSPVIELTFSAALDPAKFGAALSVSGPGGKLPVTVAFSNASSKASVSTGTLEYGTRYQLQLNAGILGQRGEVLEKALQLYFTTVEQGVISEMAPCITATEDCLQSFTMPGNSGTSGKFSFYGSYPVFEKNARWKNLRTALIVLHGQNRDADFYFTTLTAALRKENLQGQVALAAPFFKSAAEAKSGDLYWGQNDWREGRPSLTPQLPISSIEILDQLIARLADSTFFPAMKHIIVTGHSSGALLAQLYAISNRTEQKYAHLHFSYLVANSQYFYYPEDLRFDEAKSQFFTPANCPAFNRWPLGFVNAPAYLTGVPKNTIDQQMTSRNIVYVLGNGPGPDPLLNTQDCEALLLGSTRFKRGEHIFTFLETRYNTIHKSRKLIVNGVGHDGQGIYLSQEFSDLLKLLTK
jgi:hypothetical protein